YPVPGKAVAERVRDAAARGCLLVAAQLASLLTRWGGGRGSGPAVGGGGPGWRPGRGGAASRRPGGQRELWMRSPPGGAWAAGCGGPGPPLGGAGPGGGRGVGARPAAGQAVSGSCG